MAAPTFLTMQPASEADDTDPDDPAEEQDLLVVLRLSNRQMGTAAERMEIDAFAAQLETAVLDAGVGEYDGDELGGGECTLFFCGPDIDALLRVLQPMLKRAPMCRGGHLVRMVAGPFGELVRTKIPL